MFVESPSPGPATLAPEPSLAGLISWLAEQPANDNYNYCDMQGHCLFAQYHTHLGKDWVMEYENFLTFPQRHNIAALTPWTFGAALARAKGLRS